MSDETKQDLPAPKEVGSRLQAARKEAGKTQDDAAQHLGVARTTITAIEKGERRVRPSELVMLASLYGQPVSNLLRPGYASSPVALQLRAVAIPGASFESLLDPFAWNLQHLCEDYVELERICGAQMVRHHPRERSLGGISPEQSAEDIALAERNRLGLGDGPIGNLRDTLEQEVGLRIFYIELPSEVAGMFAFDDELGGCIAINRNHPEQRRKLSLAHEYAHFLTTRRRASVDFTARYQRAPESERFANAFAPAFLLPAAGLSRRFNEIKAANKGEFTYADLLTLSHYFSVSLESLTRRLEQLRLVKRGTWERIKETGFRPAEARALLKLLERATSSDLLPSRYVVLAVQAFSDERITLAQFAHFLRVDLLEARRVFEMLSDAGSRGLPLSEGAIDRQPLGKGGA